MKFGILYELEMAKPWTPNRESEVYWEALEQIKLADQLGYDYVWEVEHHFLTEYSHSSAPEVFLAAVSQHTKNIRIGHGVVLLPFNYNHPIRVAERVAALDIMSKGRVEFGTGRSATAIELGGFGIDPAATREMCDEALEVVLKAWKDEPLVHQGKRLNIPVRNVVPKPVQRPHPPIWMAGTGPDTFELAGRKGVGVLCFNFTTEMVQANLARYRAAVAQATPVGQFINNQFASLAIVHCGTDPETKRIGCEGARWFLQKVMEILMTLNDEQAKSYEYMKSIVDLSRQPKDASDDEIYHHPLVIVGDPAHCRRKVAEIEALGVDQLITFQQCGAIPHERIMESVQLFGTEVIPHFRAARQRAVVAS